MVDSLASVPSRVSASVGAVIGSGTAVAKFVEDPSITDLPYIYSKEIEMAMEFGMVFLYGAVGALGAAVVNWILKLISSKMNRK